MPEENTVILKKSCRATLVPSGLEVLLAAGSRLAASGIRNGKYEVKGVFGAALLEPSDAVGLGFQDFTKKLCKSDNRQDEQKQTDFLESEIEPSMDDLWSVAKTVYDPEIPVNVVDLGLVYCMDIKKEDGKNKVYVDMTLTAPGCAMGPAIANDLKEKLETLPSISEAVVNIVWEPPWNQDMMSQEARMILGLE